MLTGNLASGHEACLAKASACRQQLRHSWGVLDHERAYYLETARVWLSVAATIRTGSAKPLAWFLGRDV